MSRLTLFLDTGCFIARELKRDQHHALAKKGWGELAKLPDCRLYCSEHVFDECMTLLARRHSYAFAAKCGNAYLQSNLITWLTASEDELLTAVQAMKKYADQAVSFTDCLSFSLMKREGIRHVFGFDHHFLAARYKLWPAQ